MNISAKLDEIGMAVSIGCCDSVDMQCKPGKCCVYVHKGNDGVVFYVGKGTGNRSHSKDRQPEWHWWVANKLAGQYTVAIMRENISDEDALTIEDALMKEHRNTIINRQNWHEPCDKEKMRAHGEAGRASTEHQRKAQALDKAGNLDAAIVEYQTAYEFYRVMSTVGNSSTGARAQLPPDRYAPNTLCDAYSKCLVKAGNRAAVVELTERFFTDYGEVENETIMETGLRKRADKARKKL